MNSHIIGLKSLCKSTPHPNLCFNSLKLSLTLNLPLNLLNILLHSLQNALSEVNKLSSIFATTTHNNLIEKQKGSLQDCKELHQISFHVIQKSLSKVKSSNISDAKAYLSAALTNKDTCLEGLASSSGPQKPILVNSIISSYQHVSNSLAMLTHPSGAGPPNSVSFVGPPSWFHKSDYDGNGDGYEDPSVSMIVAKDGSGNFTSIQEAVNFAPNNSDYRTFIYIKEGTYEENVEIPSNKINIVLLGDGSDVTTIVGARSMGLGWTTFRSATVAVSGEGFLARDITFANTAGPENGQAVALRINADLSAVYKCTILGYQDTLYVHSFRQFYRECDIYGTVDYIFGNAAVVFQGCNLISRMPLPQQYTVITAQSRSMPDENTGIVIQNCSVLATDELYGKKTWVKSYLGRPWRKYSRTVYIESYIDGFIDGKGWIKWGNGEDEDLDSLYYGEYDNRGDGSVVDGRVDWGGFHVMDYYDAANFSVSEFIVGEEWLDSTSFPYDDGV
ncbi:unnamed protein product [Amaranthus hypochondriacus]